MYLGTRSTQVLEGPTKHFGFVTGDRTNITYDKKEPKTTDCQLTNSLRKKEDRARNTCKNGEKGTKLCT